MGFRLREQKEFRRPVFIDGRCFGKLHCPRKNSDSVSCKGILLALQYFLKRGHLTTILLPQSLWNRERNMVRVLDGKVFDKLQELRLCERFKMNERIVREAQISAVASSCQFRAHVH